MVNKSSLIKNSKFGITSRVSLQPDETYQTITKTVHYTNNETSHQRERNISYLNTQQSTLNHMKQRSRSYFEVSPVEQVRQSYDNRPNIKLFSSENEVKIMCEP